MKHAQNAWKNNVTLLEGLSKDKTVTKKIPLNKLKTMFDLNYHLKSIDIIYKRIFK